MSTTTDSTALRLIGYCRVSTSEQANEGVSLDAQRAKIQAYAAAIGAELVEIIEDAGVSGTKPLADRPGGRRIAALMDARKPTADAVAVVKLDRLGRDASESMALFKKFRTGKFGLVSITERVDLASPHGRAMAAVSAVFAELERDLISQRTSEALSELRSQGRVYGSVPFGWADQDGHLVPVAAEQATLARMRELREEGLAFNRVATKLTQEGHMPKRAAAWSAMAVRSVLMTSAKLAA